MRARLGKAERVIAPLQMSFLMVALGEIDTQTRYCEKVQEALADWERENG